MKKESLLGSIQLLDVSTTKVVAVADSRRKSYVAITPDAESPSAPGDPEDESQVLEPHDDNEEETHVQTWHIAIDVHPKYLDIVLNLSVESDESRLEVEILGHFHHDGRKNVTDIDKQLDIVRKEAMGFARDRGYETLIPYIRETSAELARRIEMTPPTIPISNPNKLLEAFEEASSRPIDS